jgi:hypothetical protein
MGGTMADTVPGSATGAADQQPDPFPLSPFHGKPHCVRKLGRMTARRGQMRDG